MLRVDGAELARTTIGRTVPGAFSASETLGVGIDLGSPVSLDYFDRRPFRFNGKIFAVEVELTQGQGGRVNLLRYAAGRLLGGLLFS